MEEKVAGGEEGVSSRGRDTCLPMAPGGMQKPTQYCKRNYLPPKINHLENIPKSTVTGAAGPRGLSKTFDSLFLLSKLPALPTSVCSLLLESEEKELKGRGGGRIQGARESLTGYRGSLFLFPLNFLFLFSLEFYAQYGPWFPDQACNSASCTATSGLCPWTSREVPKRKIQKYNSQELSRTNEAYGYTDRWCSADHKQGKHEKKGQPTISQMTLDTEDNSVNLKAAKQTDILQASR